MCYAQVLGESLPRARIEHRCDECRRPIKTGRLYLRQRNVMDGHAYTWKACERCAAMLKDAIDPGDGCVYGPVRDSAREEIRNTSWREYAARLRSRVRDLRVRLRR